MQCIHPLSPSVSVALLLQVLFVSLQVSCILFSSIQQVPYKMSPKAAPRASSIPARDRMNRIPLDTYPGGMTVHAHWLPISMSVPGMPPFGTRIISSTPDSNRHGYLKMRVDDVPGMRPSSVFHPTASCTPWWGWVLKPSTTPWS